MWLLNKICWLNEGVNALNEIHDGFLTYWAERKSFQETGERREATWQLKPETALNLEGWRPEVGTSHSAQTWNLGRWVGVILGRNCRGRYGILINKFRKQGAPEYLGAAKPHVGFPGGSMVRIPPANAGDTRDVGLIPVLERSPGGGNGNSLQYSFRKSHEQRSLVGYSPWCCSQIQLATHNFFFFFLFWRKNLNSPGTCDGYLGRGQ